jgi:hypothetical protein
MIQGIQKKNPFVLFAGILCALFQSIDIATPDTPKFKTNIINIIFVLFIFSTQIFKILFFHY